ncbi:MAG: sigma-70 family RNA polymerase sigma factor [Fimbriimonadaceae bacterium]|nr:sigma-70 family RNA polymerase sigma factor [Fimbriimonadaceae bacterium]QYK57071.1 MAG: sigma-70 family RNA polymerase sigma factor [Fimbriimonadaceae bacterium]
MSATAELTADEQTRFEELVAGSYAKVYHLAYRLSGDRNDAEDLTQEAFFRAYRGFPAYEGDKPFENWIFRIVTRLFLDLNRARRRRVKTVSYDAPLRLDSAENSVQFDSPDPAPTPDEAVLRGEIDEKLERSLTYLTPEQRRLVWLADVEGVSYKEIAEMTGAPVGTVRSRLHRAHRRLRQILESFGSGDSAKACPA